MNFQAVISSHCTPTIHNFSSTLLSGFLPPTIAARLHSQSLVLRNQLRTQTLVTCSISQVRNHGTVDYEKRQTPKWNTLFRRILMMEDPSLGSAPVLDKWVEEGRKLTKWDLSRIVKELRKYRRFKSALEVYEWMNSRGDRFRLNTSDVAIQLDLISKVHGVSSAEEYFSVLPEDAKDKRTYGALLHSFGQAKMKDKAQSLVDRMKHCGFTTDSLPYNVMMTLYMNLNEYENVTSVVNEMKENNIPLDLYSYNIWITSCAAMGDAEKMERVVEQMEQNTSINADWTTYSTLAGMYIKFGHFEKAANRLKDVELRVTRHDREPYNYLISLYASIGRKEDVYRIWNYYKLIFPTMYNFGYKAILSSLVRLGDIDGAEAIYKEWLINKSSWDPKICNILLRCYIKRGLMMKAEKFLDEMLELGAKPNPNTWELLAEGYIREKDISKALSCVSKAASIERMHAWGPNPANIVALLSLSKEKADTQSAESLMEILRRIGCLDREEYKTLITTDGKSDLAEIESLGLGMEETDDGISDETEVLFSGHHKGL